MLKEKRHVQYEKLYPKLWLYPAQIGYLAAAGIKPEDIPGMYPIFEEAGDNLHYNLHHQLRFHTDCSHETYPQEGSIEFLFNDGIQNRPILGAVRSLLSSPGNHMQRQIEMRVYQNYGAHLIFRSPNEYGIDQVTLAYNYLGDVVPTRRAYNNGSPFTTRVQERYEPAYPLYPDNDHLAPELTDEKVGKWTSNYLEDTWGLSLLLHGGFSPQQLFRTLVMTRPLHENEGRNPLDFRHMMALTGLLPESDDLNFFKVFQMNQTLQQEARVYI